MSRKIRFRYLLAGLLALLGSFLSVAVPVGAADPGYTITRDVLYKTAPDGFQLRLDVCAPTAAGPFPAMILVHRGGWRELDKSTLQPWCEKFALNGYSTVNINYRLSPCIPELDGVTCTSMGNYRAPAHAQDVASAVTWVRRNAAKLKANEARVGMLGTGVGGQLALLVAMTGAPHQTMPEAVGGWSASTDFTIIDPDKPDYYVPNLKVTNYAGCAKAACPDKWAKHSPITWVGPGKASVYQAFAVDGRHSQYTQATTMADRLTAAGVPNTLQLVSGTNAHGEELDPYVWNDTLSFFNSALK